VTTTCPHCGGILIPGQPVCADCGKPTASASAPGGSALEPQGAAREFKRDKSRDFLLIGSLIAEKYRVLDVLGQGGFGTVYLVEITAGMVGERLALKLLPEELSVQAAFRGQFLNEIRLAMRVVDRYIVQIRDVGITDDGRLYYTMDLSLGGTLAQVLRDEGRLAVTRASLIVLNVLRALQTAHAAGIVHLDLKPANIMVENQGGKETIRVLDFGIATAVLAQSEKRKGFAGSPHYMPPEQFIGEEVGFFTDLYSIGVVLYECVTGQKPYAGSSAREIFNNLKSRPPILPEALNPEVAAYPGLSELILKAMERNPERRFQSAKELFDALNAIVLRATVADAAAPAAPEPREGPRAELRAASPPRAPRRRPLTRVARRTSDSRGGLVVLVILTLASVGLFVVFQDDIRRLVSPAAPDAEGSSTDVASATVGRAKPEGRAGAPPSSTPPVRQVGGTPGEDASIVVARKKAEEELASRVKSFIDDAKKSLDMKHWPGAIERAEVALRMDPENIEAHHVRGIAAFESGDFTVAAESLDRARVAAPGGKVDRALLLRLSRAKLRAEPPKLQEAEDVVKSILRDNPKDAEAIILLIEVLEKEGRLDDRKRVVAAARKGKVVSPEIDALWEKIFVVEPKKRREDAAKLQAAAREAFDKGEWKEAAGLAEAWGTVYPEDGADILAADSFLELGELEKAKKAVERALERARQYAEGGLDEEPAPPAEQVAARSRLDGRLQLLEGRLRMADWEKTGKTDELAHAEEAFRKAIGSLGKLDGKTEKKLGALARLGLARVAAVEGNATLVAEASRPIQGTDDPAVALEEGRVLMLLAERSTAGEEVLKALNLAKRKLVPIPKLRGISEKNRAEAHFLIGLVNLRLGDLERNDRSYRLAVESFTAARQAGFNTAELNDRWALAYDRIGNLVKAAQLYRAAYDIEKSATACLRAAESQLKANPRSPEAAALLKEGTKLFPENQEIQRRYRELSE
jgi:tetratricopeptide (TPR) repeat protein